MDSGVFHTQITLFRNAGGWYCCVLVCFSLFYSVLVLFSLILTAYCYLSGSIGYCSNWVHWFLFVEGVLMGLGTIYQNISPAWEKKMTLHFLQGGSFTYWTIIHLGYTYASL